MIIISSLVAHLAQYNPFNPHLFLGRFFKLNLRLPEEAYLVFMYMEYWLDLHDNLKKIFKVTRTDYIYKTLM